MTNLEAKQEAIKKAYGELFEKYKDRIDNDGFIHYKSEKVRKEITSLLGEIESSHNYSIFRPKSLQGIENNNGWIRIDDFVKYTNEKFWIFNSHINDLYQGQLFDDDMFPINRHATHYQPIEKPLKPIY